MAEYRIIEVKDRRDVGRFVRFPDELYRGCPQYVPALHSDETFLLTGLSTLSYCSRRMWLALSSSSRVVGRICAIINPRYNELYGTKNVRFGWFDCIDDIEVARLLIDTAEAWASEQGMTRIHGPLGYNTLGRQGLLVEGYEYVPPFNCPYNYPYYGDFLSALGFEKECDWVQYRMVANHGVPDKARRVARMLQEKSNLHFVDIDTLKKDSVWVRRFFKAFNDSFEHTVYGFVPLTDDEVKDEAGRVLRFLNGKSCCMLMDGNDDIVAFGISFPSISAALQKAGGRLFPFGWIHLLKAKYNYELTDLMAHGAVPEWQNKGVSSVYYKEMGDKAIRIGNRWAISNPQIETDSAANIWNCYEHEPYMRRRCYIKNIQK